MFFFLCIKHENKNYFGFVLSLIYEVCDIQLSVGQEDPERNVLFIYVPDEKKKIGYELIG